MIRDCIIQIMTSNSTCFFCLCFLSARASRGYRSPVFPGLNCPFGKVVCLFPSSIHSNNHTTNTQREVYVSTPFLSSLIILIVDHGKVFLEALFLVFVEIKKCRSNFSHWLFSFLFFWWSQPDSENLKSTLDGEREDEVVEEYVYKILVVGDLGCGKTSYIHRYVNHTFSNTYRATVSFPNFSSFPSDFDRSYLILHLISIWYIESLWKWKIFWKV